MSQEQIHEVAADFGCLSVEQRAWLKRMYRGSGIESRGTVVVREDEDKLETARRFYPPATGPDDRGPTTAIRLSRYAQEAPRLAQAAAKRALADAQVDADQITHLITVSCTGFFSPGLDAGLIEQLSLPRGVRRLHVGFMGCHAAFNALAAARDAAAEPGARVLVCCVELCSLHLAYGIDPGKLVANALFADGAAVAVVGRDPDARDSNGRDGACRLDDFSSYLVPDSQDAMTWKIGDHGFEMTLSAGVPEIIRRHLRPWCESWLARHDLKLSDVAGWAIHPGGPKILSAVGEALDLETEDLRFSKGVLARHGNMSSATVLFILQQMMGEVSGPCVAIGLGPGLMAEGMLVNR
ncbi:MAG: type III polyketide synthase [Tepidisphaeraceae bacterium]